MPRPDVHLTLLLTLAALFLSGAALIALARRGRLLDGQRGAQLWTLYRSEFLIVGAVLVGALAGALALLLTLTALGLRGTWELAGAARRPGTWPPASTIAVAAIPAAQYVLPHWSALLLAGLAVCLFLERGRFATDRQLPWAFGVLLFGVLLGLLAAHALQPGGTLVLVWAFAVIESSDAFALLFGKWLGRHRPFPRLSPGKTLEGLVGGWLTGGLVGWLLWPSLLPVGNPAPAIAVVLLGGLGGDLALSALKRGYGLKDLPPIILVQGGVLDIYDALLFAAPALSLYLQYAA